MAGREFDSFDAFASFIAKTPALQKRAIEVTAAFAAKAIKKRVIAAIGDSSKLAHLAQSTQDERTRLGYTADDPLLRTGETIRDSIEDAWSPTLDGAVAGVGSSEPIVKYHEHGYISARGGVSVPPRPVLKIAGEEALPEIAEAMSGAVNAALGFSGSLPVRMLADKTV